MNKISLKLRMGVIIELRIICCKMSFLSRRVVAQVMPSMARGRVAPVSRNMGAKAGPGGMPHFHVSPWHKHTGTVLATIMWLWVFYRAKEDGAVVLGLVHPWDAHGHEDEDGLVFAKEGVGSVPSSTESDEDGDDEHH